MIKQATNTPDLSTCSYISTIVPSENQTEQSRDNEKWNKRAKAKALTIGILMNLIKEAERTNSFLLPSLWNTWHCANVYLQHDGQIKGTYCKNRWCLVCSRIKMAKMMNEYGSAISQFENPHFLTISTVSVKANELGNEMDRILKWSSQTVRHIRKKSNLELKGFRKLESTYNDKDDTHHAHVHYLWSTREAAEYTHDKWLIDNPNASYKGQDITPSRMNAEKELFKYMAKMITPTGDMNPKALIKTFESVYRRQIIAPIGIKPNKETTMTEEATSNKDEIWVWEQTLLNWSASNGDTLTNFTPDDRTIRQLEKLKNQ